MVEEQICVDCHESWPSDRFNGKDGSCFRCRTKTIGLTWGARGKAAFHGELVSESQRRTVADAKANGLDVVPAWTKPNYGGVSGHADKLGAILNKRESTNASR